MIGEEKAALDPALTVLPEVLKAAGYTTGAFGKWGLGRTNESGRENPLSHGFDRFYGWKSQTIAHTYYPSSVVDNGKEVPLSPGTYVHDLIMARALEFIRERRRAGPALLLLHPDRCPARGHACARGPS